MLYQRAIAGSPLSCICAASASLVFLTGEKKTLLETFSRGVWSVCGCFFLFLAMLVGVSTSEAQQLSIFQECDDCPEMVAIPAGSFLMGSPEDEPGSFAWERPRHTVNIRAFAIGRTEVTFGQWLACLRDEGCSRSPGEIPGLDFPVVRIDWNDAQEYVQWLSAKTGNQYRLPSESEWEYAARAGATGRFNTGDCITTQQANFDGSNPAAGCPQGVSLSGSTLVRSFPANAFGLYDTHGNVIEWVQDCWNNDYTGAPSDGSPWMTGFFNCTTAVLRGGSFESEGANVRLAFRAWLDRSIFADNLGFRVARVLDAGETPPPVDPVPLAPSPSLTSSDGVFKGSFEDSVSLEFSANNDQELLDWLVLERSEPSGTSGWFFGDPEIFPAHAGQPDEYVAADFNSTGDTGTISLWLVSPVIEFSSDSTVSFWTRSLDSSAFPDRLEVRACTGDSCGFIESGADAVGDFTVPLATINRELQANIDQTGISGYPNDWTRFEFGPAEGLPTSGTGRLAFRYFVVDAGLNGSNSLYIGLDTIRIRGKRVN